MGIPQLLEIAEHNDTGWWAKSAKSAAARSSRRGTCVPSAQAPAYEPYTFSGAGEVYSHRTV